MFILRKGLKNMMLFIIVGRGCKKKLKNSRAENAKDRKYNELLFRILLAKKKTTSVPYAAMK